MKKIFLMMFFVVCAFILGYLIGNNCEYYKIYMHPTYRADQYLLNTKNGDIWHLVEGKDKTLFWEPMLKLYSQDLINKNHKE